MYYGREKLSRLSQMRQTMVFLAVRTEDSSRNFSPWSILVLENSSVTESPTTPGSRCTPHVSYNVPGLSLLVDSGPGAEEYKAHFRPSGVWSLLLITRIRT